MQLLGESRIVEPAGDAIGHFKNQRLQDYFAASFIAAVGLPKFAEEFTETGAVNFWWDQALSIYLLCNRARSRRRSPVATQAER